MSRRVVITGGASGIGARMAERFAALGDRVAVCDADPASVADFGAAHPGIRAVVADVRDEAAMDAFLGGVEAVWGGVDVVCANAGTGGPAGRIEDLGYAEWKDCLAVNLNGAYLTCRWAARVMRGQGAGLIVLTSSTSGQWGHPNRSPYAAAKWGIIGLMKTLAMELGPYGVRANAICPGSVNGPRIDRVFAAEAEAKGMTPAAVAAGYAAGTALGCLVTAQDVADMAVFLASDGARMVSGQAMAVDGMTYNVDP